MFSEHSPPPVYSSDSAAVQATGTVALVYGYSHSTVTKVQSELRIGSISICLMTGHYSTLIGLGVVLDCSA